MRKKIDDGGFETPYRLRKQVVEPVFGQIKQAAPVRAEWAMICTTHNLLKLSCKRSLTRPTSTNAQTPIWTGS
jgi:hypothetical protein